MTDTDRAPPVSAEAPARNFSEQSEKWEQYVELVRARMVVSEAQYGVSSFLLPVDATVEEIENELLDIVGWGFICWRRMEALKAALHEKLQADKTGR